MTNSPAPAAQTIPSNQVRLQCGQVVNSQLGLHELISPHLVDAVLQHTSVNLSLLPPDEGSLIPQVWGRTLQRLFHALINPPLINSPHLSDEWDRAPPGRELLLTLMLAHPPVDVFRATHVEAGLAVLPAQSQDVDAAPPHRPQALAAPRPERRLRRRSRSRAGPRRPAPSRPPALRPPPPPAPPQPPRAPHGRLPRPPLSSRCPARRPPHVLYFPARTGRKTCRVAGFRVLGFSGPCRQGDPSAIGSLSPPSIGRGTPKKIGHKFGTGPPSPPPAAGCRRRPPPPPPAAGCLGLPLLPLPLHDTRHHAPLPPRRPLPAPPAPPPPAPKKSAVT